MILKPESLAKAPEPTRPKASTIPAPVSSVACNFIVSSFSALKTAHRVLRVQSNASARPPSIRGNRRSRQRKPVAANDAAEKNRTQDADNQQSAEHNRLRRAG